MGELEVKDKKKSGFYFVMSLVGLGAWLLSVDCVQHRNWHWFGIHLAGVDWVRFSIVMGPGVLFRSSIAYICLWECFAQWRMGRKNTREARY